MIPQFTGKERDSESGLDYFGDRYLSAAQGRFTTIDPGGDQHPEDPQSWNLYSYTRNRPLNSIDPDGGFVFALFGTLTGALSGGISAYANDKDIRAGIASGALAGAAAGAVADLTFATGGGALAIIGGAALSGAVGGAVGSASSQFGAGGDIIASRVGLAAAEGAAIGAVVGTTGIVAQKVLASGETAIAQGKGLGNPFRGKTPEQVDSMFKTKGFETRGTDPGSGKGGYVNPTTGRSYHLDPGGKYKKGVEQPHVDVNRPKGSDLPKKKYLFEKENQ